MICNVHPIELVRCIQAENIRTTGGRDFVSQAGPKAAKVSRFIATALLIALFLAV